VAPVLLCPECGTKHPLDNVAASAAFPCSGCGRTLKVPAQAREMTAAAAGSEAAAGAAASPLPEPLPAPLPEPHATRVMPAVPPEPVAAAAVSTAPPLGPPQGLPALDLARERREPPKPAPAAPAWARFLLWLVAVPLAFLVVFGFARTFGLLTTNDVTDVALAEGWRRFMPIVRLLPFVALVTALFVTGGVYGLTRLRAGQAQRGSGGASSRRPPRQSSRAGA
jgi:hypothetical protein